jgi:hypothetical protein
MANKPTMDFSFRQPRFLKLEFRSEALRPTVAGGLPFFEEASISPSVDIRLLSQ